MNEEKKIKKEDPELLVIGANRRGDIAFLEEVFFEKNILDILAITELEKWNWLHRCNLLETIKSPIETVNFYIKYGVPVNAQDWDNMTPLHYAMRARSAEAAIALLNAGADPNILNSKNIPPLSYMGAMPERLDILELMLQKGGNVHHILNQNPKESILESYIDMSTRNPTLIPIVELMEKYA